MKLTVGTTIYTAKQPTRRFSGGNVTVYAGDPWYVTANAVVKNLKYEILPADLLLPANPVLVRGNKIATICGTTGNYRLSFDINPLSVIAVTSSIIHFTYSGSDCCNFGDSGPAIYFYAGTTELHVSIGDSSNGNWYLEKTYALPLNTNTTVTLECKGPDVKLTVGTSIYTAKQPTRRFSGGTVTVYAGDPWYVTANAVVKNLKYEILPANEPQPLLTPRPVLLANLDPVLARGNKIT